MKPQNWIFFFHGNYTKMLRVILNQSWRQHPTKHQLYGHLPPLMKTIKVRRTRHAGYCWRSRDELISDVLLWTPSYGRAKAGRLARTYIQQLCEDTGCSPEDLPEAMNNREEWRERVRYIRAGGTTWWWWWYIYIYWKTCISQNISISLLFLLFHSFFFYLTVSVSSFTFFSSLISVLPYFHSRSLLLPLHRLLRIFLHIFSFFYFTFIDIFLL